MRPRFSTGERRSAWPDRKHSCRARCSAPPPLGAVDAQSIMPSRRWGPPWTRYRAQAADVQAGGALSSPGSPGGATAGEAHRPLRPGLRGALIAQ
jgi:hypothetical protein